MEEVQEEGDFVVDEKEKSCTLTADGIRKAEQYFKLENLGDPENAEILHHINTALKARYLMARDKDYVVKDGQIIIVDEFTGRLMPGRRYSDGLHQAIEAKEDVEVKRESKTLATITFQNYFNKYDKKAGMTGTAKTEEGEFQDIYGMDVVEIPTNRPVARKDYPDMVFKTQKRKISGSGGRDRGVSCQGPAGAGRHDHYRGFRIGQRHAEACRHSAQCTECQVP